MFVDTHTHTLFSTDSHMTIDAAVESAINQNLSGIAFTDHYDADYTAGSPDEFHYDFNEYFKLINSYKEKFAGKLDIYRAVEVGFQPQVVDEVRETLAPYTFDYIIGSVHLIGGQDPYMGDYYDNRTKQDAYSRYLEEILKNVHLFDNYDALGHFDFICRYGKYDDKTFYYKDHSDILDEIFKHLIHNGKALEINTSTYQKAPFHPSCLKRYKELGGELVTIGSDAHFPDHVARIFDQYIPAIKDCGFDYIAHFENRKPVFTKIP